MKTMKSIFAIAMMLLTVGLFAQKMNVDTDKSSLKWHGEKVTGDHVGTIELESGWLVWEDNMITDGKFVIDMSTITNLDLMDDPENKAKLENHLKSDDFFGVKKHPEAVLKIKNSSKFENNKATVNAELIIKGITHPTEFTAQKEGNTFMAEIVVDRSKYDVRYGSGSFFDNLGDKMIYDDFTLTVEIVTK